MCRVVSNLTRDPWSLDWRYQPMWRRRMRQRATAATRLTMTSQHRGETQKPRSNRSMSLKGEKNSMVVLWWRSPVTPWNEALRKSGAEATTRCNFRGSRSQECSRMVAQHDWYKTTGKFDALTKSESPEFKVPIIRLATGCVSRPRDRRYCLHESWSALRFSTMNKDIITMNKAMKDTVRSSLMQN